MSWPLLWIFCPCPGSWRPLVHPPPPQDTGGPSERASLLPSHAGRSNGHAGNGVTYQSGGSQPMPIKAANGDHLQRPMG